VWAGAEGDTDVSPHLVNPEIGLPDKLDNIYARALYRRPSGRHAPEKAQADEQA
jgi:hypothetical protein